MPEPPDFDQIALRLTRQGAQVTWPTQARAELQVAIIEQLRQVWNARGAADLTALDPIIGKLGDCMDPDNARAFVGDALRSVDR